jgi:hypothetical protein
MNFIADCMGRNEVIRIVTSDRQIHVFEFNSTSRKGGLL